MRTYKYPILKLEPNQIFVFGSNTQGRHGKGAASWARRNAGAIYGQSRGLQGQSYAIITKDLTKDNHPSRSPLEIMFEIEELYNYALKNSDKNFLIAYSSTNTNLNGWDNKQMAVFFSLKLLLDLGLGYRIIPSNIIFEEEFAKLIN